jgi:NTE family protein
MENGSIKKIDLALQGGGAHGAFTWGVLDRLLEDGRIEIEGISGTSAGAMNAVALAQGLAGGGGRRRRSCLRVSGSG